MPQKTNILNFVSELKKQIGSNPKSITKTQFEKLARNYGILDQTDAKELAEFAVIELMREIASNGDNFARRFDKITELYWKQPNLTHRSSRSMIYQQYSTPAPITFLASEWAKNGKSNYSVFEPSAGNGLFLINVDQAKVWANEIDPFRVKVLELQNFNKITKLDSSDEKNINSIDRSFDIVLTNPPFDKLPYKKRFNGVEFTTLDHYMAVLALSKLAQNGRAAVIVGGHTPYDKKGRIVGGKNRIFISYLYDKFNVYDVINIDGDLYAKQGTSFDIRLILIDGVRKNTSEKSYPPLSFERSWPVKNFEELKDRIFSSNSSSNSDTMELKEMEAKALQLKLSMQSALGSPYMPAAQACTTLEVEMPDSMEYETNYALAKLVQKVGNVTEYLTKKLKYKSSTELCEVLAAEQIDAVALAIYNMETKQQGLIIGDQTGIGKGRQAAAIIRYGFMNGFKPVFITEKPTLFSDLYRDLVATKSEKYKPFIVNTDDSKSKIKDEEGRVVFTAPPKSEQDRIFAGGKDLEKYDYIVATYSQFNKNVVEDNGNTKTDKKGAFLLNVARENILILDESHNAGGRSNTGRFFMKVVKSSKGCAYLSATFAKRPDNMPLYALKTSLQDARMSEDDFIKAFDKGGVALQEVVASQLVLEGQMIRRERTSEGLEVNYISLEKNQAQHIAIADRITAIIRSIILFEQLFVTDEIEKIDSDISKSQSSAEKTKGTQKGGASNTPTFSRIFNLINQLLFSLKTEDVANHAIGRLKEGKSVVIAFASTMGTYVDSEETGSVMSGDFAEVLARLLKNSLKYTIKNSAGETESFYLDVLDLPMPGQEMHKQILKEIKRTSTGISLSPIDLLVQILNDAGYKVAEVTGRSKKLFYPDRNAKGAIVENRPKENANDAFRRFQNNEVDVLLINQSGSTGASAHAISTKRVKAADVRQRVMMFLQFELDINRQVQKMGRINRTGQILLPIYDYLTSVIPAEQRLLMMLQRKMKSLDANTSSNQNNSTDLFSVPDFLNKYGDVVVGVYLQENREVNKLLGDLVSETEDLKDNVLGLAQMVSGRIAVLSVEQQINFYQNVLENYKKYVEMKKQSGQYDLEMETLNLDALTINKEIIIINSNFGKSIFSDHTFLELCECNNLVKPFTKIELDQKIEYYLDNKTPAEYQEFYLSELEKYADIRSESIERQNEETYKNRLKSIETSAAPKKLETPEEIKEWREEKKETLKKDYLLKQETDLNKHNLQKSQIERVLKFFKVGRSVNFPTSLYEGGAQYSKAVFLGYDINFNKNYPFTPGNVYLKFAIADSVRQFDVNLTTEGNNYVALTISSSYDLRADFLDNWTEITAASTARRKNRYIVTGNLLQAISSPQFSTGKLVNYTKLPSGVEKGLLMPNSWTYGNSNDETNELSVPCLMAIDLIKSIRVNQTIKTNSPLTFGRDGNALRLDLPRSRSTAGEYFTDPDLLKFVKDGNFNSRGNFMVGYITDLQNLEGALEVLQNKFQVNIITEKSNLDKLELDKKLPTILSETSLPPPPLPPKTKAPLKQEIDEDLVLMELEAKALKIKLELLK